MKNMTTIVSLDNYFPLGRDVIFEKIEVEARTAEGILMTTHNVKHKVVKKGKEVKEELLGHFIIYNERAPIIELITEDNERFYQLDSAYIVGKELAIKRLKTKVEE